jgi:hypothetical protein
MTAESRNESGMTAEPAPYDVRSLLALVLEWYLDGAISFPGFQAVFMTLYVLGGVQDDGQGWEYFDEIYERLTMTDKAPDAAARDCGVKDESDFRRWITMHSHERGTAH